VLVEVIDEDKLLVGLTKANVREALARRIGDIKRAGWYFQQFLKMAYAMIDFGSEFYIVWDADTVALRPQQLFSSGGKPRMLRKEEHNAAYFSTMSKLLGIDRQVDFSFIAENMIISTSYMRELISEISREGDKVNFWRYIIDSIDIIDLPLSGFSEFETYGNYVYSKYPDSYEYIELKAKRSAGRLYGRHPSRFDLRALSKKYDLASFETWGKKSEIAIFKNKIKAFILGV